MAREVEAKTLAVRQLIDEHGPELTWNSNNADKPSETPEKLRFFRNGKK